MKLSLITLFMLHRNEHASLREVYTAVKRAGFEAVDLCSYDFAHGTEEEIRALLKELGLKVACYIDFVPSPAIGNAAAAQRAREQIRRNLDLTEDWAPVFTCLHPADTQTLSAAFRVKKWRRLLRKILPMRWNLRTKKESQW